MGAMPTLHATVHGYVQGVGFRYFVRRRAHELGLSGWAANRPDGTVRVEAFGAREALMALVQALAEGPVASRVERVDHVIEEGGHGREGFRVRHDD